MSFSSAVKDVHSGSESFSWSSDAANSVGAEYIIMEKVRGVALSDTWEAMNTLEHYKIIDQVVQMDKELSNISFPAYGSLYLRDSLPATCRQYPLPPELDPEGPFCIGPSCKQNWWHGNYISISFNRRQKIWGLVGIPASVLCAMTFDVQY